MFKSVTITATPFLIVKRILLFYCLESACLNEFNALTKIDKNMGNYIRKQKK